MEGQGQAKFRTQMEILKEDNDFLKAADKPALMAAIKNGKHQPTPLSLIVCLFYRENSV